ncbi:MAG: hypothetical protein A2288_02225 [Candidatus Moranbacteria bacterium RIFOXYA12_FULL_44_15]|nr:MAG: hypothetical protein A2288_02225 [Candidatus Moranbacteria bacterium RIFOXYA12_FULL_44_15]OGI36537.1 MAG: hypothetical protein A2259_02945 [Candidatus Moranbacteria bacterium RIFOXYA2_FULL_43_15]
MFSIIFYVYIISQKQTAVKATKKAGSERVRNTAWKKLCTFEQKLALLKICCCLLLAPFQSSSKY